MKRKSVNRKFWRHFISTPFIWGMVVPTFFLHLSLLIYQAGAFRLYGIDRVKLRDFISFDRSKLSYLSLFDKINCAYCTYVNGVYGYASEIGHRTEYYWCGVKHCNQPNNPAFAYQEKFAAYGSQEEYERILIDSGRRSAR